MNAPSPQLDLRRYAHAVSALLIDKHRSEFSLGKVIDDVLENQLWAKWPDTQYKDFSEWVWGVLGFRRSKAYHFRKIYKTLSSMPLAEDTIVRALRLGWAKLIHVLRVARNEQVIIQWLNRCEVYNLTEATLKAEVQVAFAKLSEADKTNVPDLSEDHDEEEKAPETAGAAGEAPKEKAKEAAPAETAKAGEPSKKPPEKPTRIGIKVNFTGEDEFDIFVHAHKAVQKRTSDNELSYGRTIALMATHYLATVPEAHEGGLAMELQQLLAAIEHTYKVHVEAVDVAAAPVPVAAPVTRPVHEGANTF